ncbi:SHOCT domain-containing protein [Timonella senegalensis]|uniref:SHOCT domain-containing protein n=1 Tax=Timonella senegalensis TaxID=1465825 RepID=UPI0002DE9BEF|nr:SHOCT domain-containing protein [Timonella senegalensis]
MPILNRGGRPGLLGMAARTAVVAGTATAVSGRVEQRQQARAMDRQMQAAEHQMIQQQQQQAAIAQAVAEQAAAAPMGAPVAPVAPEAIAPAVAGAGVPGAGVPAPPAPAPGVPGDDLIARLQQLGQLHQQGILTDQEFAAAKQQILGG